MIKQKIALLYGAPSSEHSVSISSAKNILKNIDREKFDVLEVYITEDCQYTIGDTSYSEEDGLQEIKKRNIEVVFPIIHGAYGEDGVLQKKLEDLHIQFVGSGSVESSTAIDKNKSNEVYTKNNIQIPKSKIITKENYVVDLNFPIIIKPVDEGSSVGLFRFENEEEYKNNLEKVFEKHSTMLVQEFITGREFTCGVIDIDGISTPFVATEVILTKGNLFDFEAKYTPGGCKEITPAGVDASLMERILELAVLCHKVLGCKSISRTDMILSNDILYVLETNTMPGMTETSFIPAQAKAVGIEMKELITILIGSVRLL